jgi:hypothetical protein
VPHLLYNVYTLCHEQGNINAVQGKGMCDLNLFSSKGQASTVNRADDLDGTFIVMVV